MQKANYIRLFADKNGESHFEDLEINLSPTDYAPPAAPLNFAQFLPAVQSFWLGGASDWGGDVPHPAPRPHILCCLHGELVVTASDGTTRSIGPGGVLLVEDTWGKGHSSRITKNALAFGVALANS